MKKLSFLILIIFFFSCEKEDDLVIPEKFCWTCEFYYPNGLHGVVPYSERRTVCDYTEEEIRSYEKETSYNTGPKRHQTTCWKKY